MAFRRGSSTNAYDSSTQTGNRSPVQTSMFCSSGQVIVRESSVNTSTGQVVINVAGVFSVNKTGISCLTPL